MSFERDLRYAIRNAVRAPLFTITTVLTLALCIGANSAVFSVVDAALLRPPPYPEPERLAQIATFVRSSRGEATRLAQDGRTWEGLRDGLTKLDVAAFSNWATGVNLALGTDVGFVQQQRVSAGFFRVLGIAPRLGREFTEVEDRPGGGAVVVISHALWQRIWNGDVSAVGRTVLLRGEPHTVVGIMPPDFRSSVAADLWTPLRPSRTGEGSGRNYQIVGRLRDGVSWVEADSVVRAVGRALLEEEDLPGDVTARYGLVSLQHGLSQGLRTPLLILWGAVGVVLLVGCVNVGSMLLARSAGRVHEIGTRMALGGSRIAILRQLVTESLVYAVFGGVAGIAVGKLALIGLQSLAPDTISVQAVSFDTRVLAMTAGLALVSVVLFGLFPALQTSKLDVRSALGGGRNVVGASGRRPYRVMVAGQVTLAVGLLLIAGLLIRSFYHLWQVPPGFDSTNVLTATFSLQDARYQSTKKVEQLFRDILLELEQARGVDVAAVGLALPYERWLNMPFRFVGSEEGVDPELTTLAYVTPRYFEVLRIPLLRGRTITSADGPNAAKVLVVNNAFVKRYLRGEDPLGVQIDMAGNTREIVGVAGDVQQRPSWGTAMPVAPVPAAYVPAAQTTSEFLQLVHTWFSPSIIVRARGPAPSTRASIQEAVTAVDPLLPIAAFRTLEDVKRGSLALQQFLTTLLSVFAGLAVILAGLGIYGMVAGAVAARSRELSIRMAVGATASRAVAIAIEPALLLAAVGAAFGCALGLFFSRALEHFIWGVRATDPLTLGAVIAGALLMAAAASLVPAARVLRLSPAQKLREE